LHGRLSYSGNQRSHGKCPDRPSARGLLAPWNERFLQTSKSLLHATLRKRWPSDNNLLGRKLIINHLITNARLFLGKSHSFQHYIQALTALDTAWPLIPSTVGGCRSYLAGELVSNAAILLPQLGLLNFTQLLIRLRVFPNVILRACLRGNAKKADEPQPAASAEVICLDNGLISKGARLYGFYAA
jgi:hypothetical protein